MQASPFRRVVCGIDGTREGFEAARQAARITHPGGAIALVAVAQFLDAMAGRWGPLLTPWNIYETPERDLGELTNALRERAHASLRQARRQIGQEVSVETRVVEGRAPEVLRDEAAREDATLIAIGAHGGRRLVGAALGGVATMLLHDAPASVLLARRPFDPCGFPSTVVVGVDGSDASLRALDVATLLCEGSDGSLTVVVATRDEEVALDEPKRRAAPHPVSVERQRPVEALVTAAAASDLLIVGSRGMRGVRALGSVSERVAHSAESSVLVVRP